MANPSNLYAEKIFSEHPLSLWALDDRVDFVSLISSNDKVMFGWTTSNNTEFLSTTSQQPYIPNEAIVPLSISNDQIATITSSNQISGSELDQSKNTFTISSYFKGDVDAIVRMGFEYNSVYTYEEFSYTAETEEGWALLSKSFDLPGSGEITLKIEIEQSVDIESNFYFNNFSVGQWSEQFISKSSGVLLEELFSYENISLPEVFAVPANSYGVAENNGYYLASSNRLYSYNEGFPIVYGASNITKIEHFPDMPSLIIPGMGFLNNSGKYYDLTAEMWIRIDVNSSEPRRIFGPISSQDGLYVHGEFLVIRVGNSYGSYFVGEWGRPMLVHFRVSQNTASLLVDGEQVISISIDTALIDMPEKFSESGSSQDWLGFYSHQNIKRYEVDCVAIYSYQIPEVVAKRRFVYGQGVEFPEMSSSSLIGSSAFIDYRVSGYANNFLYPDMARWTQGITDNVLVDFGSIKTPKYSLPTAYFYNQNMSTDVWISNCSNGQDDDFGHVNFSFANSVAGSGGYLYFNSINVLNSKVHGVYGVFKNNSPSENAQTLFKILNKTTGDYLSATITSGQISYTINDASGSILLGQPSNTTAEDDFFVAGINFSALGQKYGGRVSRFFGSSKNLEVYVAGDNDSPDNTFYGNIYRFSFMTDRSLRKIANYFSDDATTITINDQDDCLSIMNYVASYTLRPYLYIDSFKLDIMSDSYWQDYVPLSKLSGSVLNADAEYDKRISFIQFNISNPLIKNVIDNKIDTSDNQIKTYVTFQYLSSRPNLDHTSFLYSQELGDSKVIIPGNAWLQTKYEVVNDTVIYIPADVNYNQIAIVIHVEMQARRSLSEQLSIKSIQLASQAFSDVEPRNITTRFGDSLFAYVLRGIYPDYAAKNPVSIYKGSTPYMYLTDTSGIRLADALGDRRSRGIRYLLNKQASNLYRIGASQILTQYYEDLFPTEPIKILTYKGYVVQNGIRQERIISIYVVASNASQTRGRVYAIDQRTGLVDPTVYFYLNGSLVKDLHITPKTWNMIGLQFQVALDLNSTIGYVDFSGPILVNGISNYRLTSTQDSQSSILRSWSQVRTMLDKDGEATNWGDFLSSDPVITWQNVLYIPSERSFLVDAALPFRIYAGTNKIIVGDSNKLRFTQYQYRVFQDIVWQSSIFDAV